MAITATQGRWSRASQTRIVIAAAIAGSAVTIPTASLAYSVCILLAPIRSITPAFP